MGIVKAPITRILAEADLGAFDIVWLPTQGPLRFTADPFGLWKDGLLHIFVEAYDYRTGRGEIEVLILDESLSLRHRGPALREPWHLSYPFVFEAEGEIWMLPEAYRSGRLTLYRATGFPWRWERESRFVFPEAAIDATPVQTQEGWRMFYTPPAPKRWRTSALKLARADHLLGRWERCGDGPILIDRGGARMGGTPVWMEDALLLPTQDCRDTYGGALTIRTVTGAAGDAPRIGATGTRITAPPSFHPYVEGLHTLSQAGPVTLIDAKRTIHPVRHLANRATDWLRRR